MIRQAYSILLVEDVLLLAKITERMLKKSPTNQYSLVHKTNMSDALAALAAHEFDVVLLDLNLADSSGLSTVTTVIEAAPDVPIIVLTANESPEVGIDSVKLGAQDYLLKGDFTHLALDRAINHSIERHRLQRTLRRLAVIDELTGLYNRRGFNTLHPDIIESVKHSPARGYLCYFDLDRFKQINDVHGHKAGDEALVEFVAKLRAIFRKDALLVRLGGDEFLAMGVEHEAGQTDEALKALETALSERNREGLSPFELNASSGVAYFDKKGPHALEELSALADADLYRNKESRRHLGDQPPRETRVI